MMRKPGRARAERGFSLLEATVVITLILIVSALSVVGIQVALRRSRAASAMQTVTLQLRRARQAAIDERRLFFVTLEVPNRIRVQRRNPDTTLTQVGLFELPVTFQYCIEPGTPDTPDGFGLAAPVNFNGGNQLIFRPDGSAVDAIGRFANGTAFVCRPGDITLSSAVTILGATGRIKGYRFEAGAFR